ncbi:MAG: mucoidy inhibitor MuiA family protein [Alphaproteobacteria bacterium]|nr:mucoidy inhibitor MuiA family protein [Alphaproteobacteria bacterium]
MLTFLALTAYAQHDYSAEAKSRLQLDFDLDQVEAELSQPARARPSAAEAYHDPYAPPPPPAEPRLPLEPNSTLRSVTVFADRALVTREQDLDVKQGTHTVVFEGLPHGIRSEGLSGLVVSGGARIVGVELVSPTSEVAEDARFEAIRTEALAITKQLGEVRDRIEALLGQRAYLRFTLLAQRGEGASQPPLSEVRGTLAYVGEAEADLARKLREEEESAKELGEKLRPLLVKMKNPVATGRVAKVEVEAKGGKATVGLRYQVDGAGWTPAYNARLLPDEKVEIEYFGVVHQDTGEAWTDAELSLSTANAASSATLPALTPWYLGRDDTTISLDTGALVAPVANDAGPKESGLVSSELTAKIEGAGAVVFAIQGKRTIAGDGSSQRLTVGRQTFTAVLDYATVPKLVPEVHRRASIRYDGKIPLFPGDLSTFVAGDYLGKGSTTAVVPGEALRLSFGADDRLKVTRQLVTRRQEFIGAGQKTTRYTFHFRIVVANWSGETRRVELRDQLPISELDKVSVKSLAMTEGATEVPGAGPGIYRWDLEIPDGQEKTVDLEFQVTAPTEVAYDALRSMQLLF